MKLCCSTPLCFQLQRSNRATDPVPAAMLDFIRNPSPNVPKGLPEAWDAMRLVGADARLQEERFQSGHMIACYWETVSRWIMMRAKRDADALETHLYLIQAADVSHPPMLMCTAAKLTSTAAPKDVGGMHGMLPVHLGMPVRFLEALDIQGGLVKDAEGIIVDIVFHPSDASCPRL